MGRIPEVDTYRVTYSIFQKLNKNGILEDTYWIRIRYAIRPLIQPIRWFDKPLCAGLYG